MSATGLDRDELLRRATQLYNELARIRKLAKRAARIERAPYDQRAAELAAELRVLLDQHEGIKT